MKEWLRSILAAVGISLLWATVWAAVGALIRIVDPRGAMDALWLGPEIGMHPGFVAGVVFSALLGIAAGHRRLHELSFSKVVACGGMAGLLIGMLPFAINEPASEAPLWLVGVAVVGSMTLLGALSAAGSRALARMASGLASPRSQESRL